MVALDQLETGNITKRCFQFVHFEKPRFLCAEHNKMTSINDLLFFGRYIGKSKNDPKSGSLYKLPLF